MQVAAEEVPLTETLENGYIETFEDQSGNKTELEYLLMIMNLELILI